MANDHLRQTLAQLLRFGDLESWSWFRLRDLGSFRWCLGLLRLRCDWRWGKHGEILLFGYRCETQSASDSASPFEREGNSRDGARGGGGGGVRTLPTRVSRRRACRRRGKVSAEVNALLLVRT